MEGIAVDKCMRHTLLFLPLAILTMICLQGCIEDGVTTSAADQPSFSIDTLKLGTVWTAAPTPTYRFTVYNRHEKILNISRVSFRDDPQDNYRLNVDGTAGREISNVEIRPNDSVYVFVEATLPPTGEPHPVKITSHIDFLVNGQTSSVAVTADACDIRRLTAAVVASDTVFRSDYPIQIFDSLVVAPGATLTLEPGVRLHFHDKARMIVRGTLIARGTPEKRVDMTGDRNGNVVASIPYDIMSAQWDGLRFAQGSIGNRLEFTTVRNTVNGVRADSLSQVEIRSSVLRNAAGYPFSAIGAGSTLIGCEIAEGGDGVIYLRGGNSRVDHCTVANHYLFSVIGGPAIQIDCLKEQGSVLPTVARFSNTIIYGLGEDLNHTDLEGSQVTFSRCLFKSNGSDDSNFVNCLWDIDPLYLVDRGKYMFDYHLEQKSPALGEAEPSEFADILSPDGTDIKTHIGAYGPGK